MVAGLWRGNPARHLVPKGRESYEVVNPKRAMGVSREIPCAAHTVKTVNPGAPTFLSACGRSEKAREGQAGVRSTRGVRGKKP
jgi:hypothetical protein